jgi:hypothetical protein
MNSAWTISNTHSLSQFWERVTTAGMQEVRVKVPVK